MEKSYKGETTFIAFKVMRRDLVKSTSSFIDDIPVRNGRETVAIITERIRKESIRLGFIEEDESFVEEGPIISLAEAEKNTDLLTRLTHNIKSFIWL